MSGAAPPILRDGNRGRRASAVTEPGRGRASEPEQHLEAVRPGGAAPQTAERAELRGELRRVIYGGSEFVRHESGSLPDEWQRRSRRQEAQGPREKNGKIEQNTNEGVPVVTDLKRFDTEGPFNGSAGDGGHALDQPKRQDFHAQQRYQNDRHEGSQR